MTAWPCPSSGPACEPPKDLCTSQGVVLAWPFVCQMGRPALCCGGRSWTRLSDQPRPIPPAGQEHSHLQPLCFWLRSSKGDFRPRGADLSCSLWSAPWCFMRLRNLCGSRGVV